MSTDSSSKDSVELTGSLAYGRALLTVLGTIGLFIAGQIIGIVLVVVSLSLVGLSSEEISDLFSDNVYAQFFAILVVETVTLGLLVLWHRARGINVLRAIRLTRLPQWKDVWQALGAYGLYFLTFLVVVLLVPLLLPAVDVDQSQQLGFESPVGIEYVFVFLSLVILPPVTEEILFRGFMFQRLRQYIKPAVAVGITSVVFAAAHLEFFSGESLNWIAAIDTFVLSLFLIWVYVKSDSLWSAIFLHGIKNLVAFTVLFVI